MYHLQCLAEQCFLFSRNMGHLTPENMYFHYVNKYLLNQRIQKRFCLILKTEALGLSTEAVGIPTWPFACKNHMCSEFDGKSTYKRNATPNLFGSRRPVNLNCLWQKNVCLQENSTIRRWSKRNSERILTVENMICLWFSLIWWDPRIARKSLIVVIVY